MITEAGDMNTSLLAGLDNSGSSLDLNGLSIDEDLDFILDDRRGAELARSYISKKEFIS